ncbi:MAG: hypothetical protein WA813_23900, partial [Beijerinckiaceae bacterium]
EDHSPLVTESMLAISKASMLLSSSPIMREAACTLFLNLPRGNENGSFDLGKARQAVRYSWQFRGMGRRS